MLVFKTKCFARYAKQRIADKPLCEAIKRAERGIIDAKGAILSNSGFLKRDKADRRDTVL